jgi:hypothetical protein
VATGLKAINTRIGEQKLPKRRNTLHFIGIKNEEKYSHYAARGEKQSKNRAIKINCPIKIADGSG